MPRVLSGTFFAVVAVLACGAEAAPAVRQLHVVHRHGSRTPIVANNASRLCGEIGCGQLTDVGSAMLQSIGRYIRDTPEYAALLGTAYNPNRVRSRSTGVQRTLQSAAALLHGMFPNTTGGVVPKDVDNTTADVEHRMSVAAPVPAIFSERTSSDHVLIVPSLMSYLVPLEVGNIPPQPRVPPATVVDAVSDDELVAIARETHQVEECGDKARFADKRHKFHCLTIMYDIWECSLSAYGDVATKYPKLGSKAAGLLPAHHMDFLPFNYTLPFVAEQAAAGKPGYGDMLKRGSFGYNLASTIVNAMETYAKAAHPLKPTHENWPVGQVYHWSGHDSTLAAFSTALGTPLLDPRFAQTYLLELREDTAAKTPAERWSVAVRYGRPAQTPHEAANDAPNFDNIKIGCAAGDSNAELTTRSEECPLEKFGRFVHATGPRTPAGACYVPEDALRAVGCLDTGFGNEWCQAFREACPTEACPSFHKLVRSHDKLTCVAIHAHVEPGPSKSFSHGKAFGFTVLGLVIGAAVTGGVGFVIRRRMLHQSSTVYVPVN